jgi:hypothetical protein
MNASVQVGCSFALTFGVPIVISGWELRLKPTPWRPLPQDDLPEPAPLPDTGVSPRSNKPLPDCPIPQAGSVRVGELA